MINWKVRVKSLKFWAAVIPAIFVLVQAVLGIFGIQLDFGALKRKALEAVNALFIFLAIVGIVEDPTSAGISDSEQALMYMESKK